MTRAHPVRGPRSTKARTTVKSHTHEDYLGRPLTVAQCRAGKCVKHNGRRK